MFEDSDICQTNIKDFNNFIAALIAKFDTDKLFESVDVDGVNVPILRDTNKPKTKTVHIIGELQNKIVLLSNVIETLDLNAQKVSVTVPSLEVKIPFDGVLSSSPFI